MRVVSYFVSFHFVLIVSLICSRFLFVCFCRTTIINSSFPVFFRAAFGDKMWWNFVVVRSFTIKSSWIQFPVFSHGLWCPRSRENSIWFRPPRESHVRKTCLILPLKTEINATAGDFSHFIFANVSVKLGLVSLFYFVMRSDWFAYCQLINNNSENNKNRTRLLYFSSVKCNSRVLIKHDVFWHHVPWLRPL